MTQDSSCIPLESGITAHLLYCVNSGHSTKLAGTDLVPVLTTSIETANKLLQLTDFNIVLEVNAQATIPEVGIGGYTPTSDIIRIALDLEHSVTIKEIVRKRLPPIIAHEMHHIRRYRKIGYGKTLLEVLVTEGLATFFEQELYPETDVPWAYSLSVEEINQILPRVHQEGDSIHFDHAEWFFGSGNLKKWTGYSIGHRIVEKYLKQNPQKRVAELADINAQEISKEKLTI